MRVKLTRAADGAVEAVKHAQEGAGVITSLTETDGLVELSEEQRASSPARPWDFSPTPRWRGKCRAQIRTAEVVNAASTGFWTRLSTATAPSAITAAAMQAADNVAHGWFLRHCICLDRYIEDQELVARELNGRIAARNALGLGRIFRRVDVEERVDRRRRPIGDGNTVTRGPDLDLVQALLEERLAQVIAQRNRP